MMENIGLLVLVTVLALVSIVINGRYAFSGKHTMQKRPTKIDDNVRAGVLCKKFDPQKYVKEHIGVYGVINMGVSLNGREIHIYDYDAMGIEDND